MKSFILPTLFLAVSWFFIAQVYANSPFVSYTHSTTIVGGKPKQPTALSVFPNPTKDVITICNIVNYGVKEIEIFDLMGEKKKVTFTSGLRDAIEMDLSNLTNGVYFIRFYNKKGESIEMLKISKV